ncbi:hypothetical protein D3C86_1108790 [compost metagenome]
MVAPHAGQLVDHRHQRMGVFPDVAHGKIRDGIGPRQRRKGKTNEQEHHDRAERGDIHQRPVVAARADNRQRGNDQPHPKRQHQNVMADLVDHLVAPVLSGEVALADGVAAAGSSPSPPCCHRPLSFSRSATSFGM